MKTQDPQDQARQLQAPEPEDNPLNNDVGEALTDDERVRRQKAQEGDGPRVTPGPADLERLPNP